jgi:polar amino acid transport system substrate-binding protein
VKLARRPVALLACLTALALAVTGCAASVQPKDLTGLALSPVAPAGMAQGQAALAGSQSAPDTCDATASLRPQSLPSAGNMPAGSTMATIYRRGYLTVGVDQSTYLWGYLNPLTSQLEGFDIDVADAVAHAIFGANIANRVQFRAITSGQRVGSLTGAPNDPQVDLVVRTFTVNCQREQQGVLFSSVYYDAQQRLLVDKDSTVQGIDDLGGKKVCAAAGADSLPRVAAAPAQPIPVAVGDWSDCLVMLQQGQVDAIATDDSILAGMAAQDPNTKVVGQSMGDEPYGIGMRKTSPDFVRFVNAVLDQFRTSPTGWTQSYNTWLASRLGQSAGPPAAKYSD